MLRLRVGKHFLNQCMDWGTVYRPDFICYDMDNREYQQFWSEIKDHPKGQLYTDGIQVVKVSWLRSIFEAFKGWLGFENHCQTNKVEMTLAKVAYHGYLKGYRPNTFQQLNQPLISDRFQSLVNADRTNANSATLQHLLMSYYISNSDAISNTPIERTYPFGQTWIDHQFYQLVPSLDPQEAKIISESIRGMHYSSVFAEGRDYFPSSPFASSYAEYLAGQSRFEVALQWSPQVRFLYKEQYIRFFLSQKKTNPQALNSAMELIAALSSQEDQAKALNYIKEYFSFSEQVEHTTPYPQLRMKLAQSYLVDAKAEKDRFALTKLFIGNKVIPLLTHALRLVPDILAQDNSMQEIVLKEEWFIYQFKEAIKDQRFTDAKQLFETHPAFKFEKSHLMQLRASYLEEMNAKQLSAKTAFEQGEYQLAESTALEVVDIARKVALITPQDTPIINANVEYAATLLAIDMAQHPDSKNADMKALSKAQQLLNNCSISDNSPRYKQLYNNLLLRKIECLMEQIRVPIDFNDNHLVRAEFVPQIKGKLDLFRKNLDTFIQLNENNKSLGMRQILGRLLYLKGDVFYFFTRNKQEALPHFKRASELMPENPYYRYRYYECANDERRHNVWTEIEEMRYLNGSHYNMWETERWNDERVMSEGFDIHNIPAENQGIFSTFSRIFSG
jgi:tetratricopeptide (TPR) repeat protein